MNLHSQQAHADYERVRRQAAFSALLARLCGRPNDLLSYHEIRCRLAVESESYRGLRNVPVARIVGSTDRCRDFDRAFRPRRVHCAGRWLSVARAHGEGKSLPPVQLYQIGDAYFVRDGHHRVSVALVRDQPVIEAEVIEVIGAPAEDAIVSPPPANRSRAGLAAIGGGRERRRPRLLAGLRAFAYGRGRLVPGARAA